MIDWQELRKLVIGLGNTWAKTKRELQGFVDAIETGE